MAMQYCGTCGSPLRYGRCPSCPAGAYDPAAQTVITTATPLTLYQPVPQTAAQAMYANAQTYTPGARYIGQWNWGAFLLCPFWLMNHGRVGRGIICLLLSAIPYLGVAALVMQIVYGIKGNAVAATSRRFANDTQFVAVQNAWRNWGVGIFVAWIAFIGLVSIAALSSGHSR